MRASLNFCEFATVHPDGTFSAVRGGINSLQSPTVPVPLRGTILAKLEIEAGEAGSHEFALRSMDQDGKAFMPEISGTFAAQAAPGSTTMCIQVDDFPIKAYGTYAFVLTVDRTLAARTEINVTKPKNLDQKG